MNLDPEAHQIAKAIHSDPQDRASLERAELALGQGKGDQILQALITMQSTLPDEYPTIAAVMALLERIIKVAPRVGQHLMIKLYAIADPLFMHDICDAIELWLTEQGSAELAGMIKSLADAEQDELLKRRMLEWADGMPS
jgi:hypothetical protein